MQPFEYVAPETLSEALDALARHRSEARALAGGQSLVPLLSYRLAKPRVVVDLNRLDLSEIRGDGGPMTLGALVRHRELEEAEIVARRCPVLREAAGLIGNRRVRALGTLGGSLAHADPAAELPVVVTALGARLTLASAAGSRVLRASEFFTGYLTTALAPDELLVEVAIDPLEGAGWAVEEVARRTGDFAIVVVAAQVSLDARGRVEDVRLAFGGVGPCPVRAAAAEDDLRGGEPTPERIGRAAGIARQALAPESDVFASAAYRRLLAGVLARRALARAAARGLAVDGSAGAPARPARHRGLAADDHRRSRSVTGPRSPAAVEATAGGATPTGGEPLRFVLNGRAREVGIVPGQTLLAVLRDSLGVFDAKEGCGEGVCGTCTVLLDGQPVSSCLVLAPAVQGRTVMTVRGIERDGSLHPLQEAFVRHGAVQCGFCTPGMVLTALAYLERHPRPSRDEIRGALDGNLCRCTGYTKIVDAVEAYAREASGG